MITYGKHPHEFFAQRIVNHVMGGGYAVACRGDNDLVILSVGEKVDWKIRAVEKDGRRIGFRLLNPKLSYDDICAVERAVAILIGHGSRFEPSLRSTL